MKEKRITFPSNFYVSFYVFVRETRAWGVRGSKWALRDKDKSILTKDPNCIDVVTETFKTGDYLIEEAT